MGISSDLFSAFLKCRTKCWLRASGEPVSGASYADWVKSKNRSYQATEIERLRSEHKTEVAVDDEDVLRWVRARLTMAEDWLGKKIDLSDSELRSHYQFQRFQPGRDRSKTAMDPIP